MTHSWLLVWDRTVEAEGVGEVGRRRAAATPIRGCVTHEG